MTQAKSNHPQMLRQAAPQRGAAALESSDCTQSRASRPAAAAGLGPCPRAGGTAAGATTKGSPYRHDEAQRNGPAMSQDTVVKAYGRLAPLYDWVFGAVLEPGRRRLAQAVCELAPKSILEVGVGTGLTLERYPAAARVVGIDVSHEMLQRAQRRAAALPGRDITLQAMNAEQMDFPDESFDCVAVPYVLSVTPDPQRFVRELRRVCRKGGHILIVNHFSGSRFWWALEQGVKPLADKVGFRSDFLYEEHVARHDWQVVSVEPVNLMGLSRCITLRN